MQQNREQPSRPTPESGSTASAARENGRRLGASGAAFDAKRRGFAARAAGVLALFAVLYFARGVLQPLAIAGVLALVLAPIVNRLERWGLPNGVAVLSVVGVATSLLLATTALVSTQAVALIDSLPKYRANIRERIATIVHTDTGVIGRTADLVGDIKGEIAREIEETEPEAGTSESPDAPLDAVAPGAVDADAPARDTAARDTAARDTADLGAAPRPKESAKLETRVLQRLDQAFDGSGPPLAVEVAATHVSPLASARAMIGPLLAPLAGLGIVLVFWTFFLLSRRDIKDRLLQLAGRGHLQVTAAAIDEAGMRISRYLLAHLTLNLIYGIPVGLVLWALGLPGAALWGLLATLLRFIPYVGPWASALLPLVLSLAVFEGWTKPMYVAGTFIGLELVSNNILEPWIYGSKSGLSTVAVLLAALVWGWLWGAVGIVLAVPLTVIVVVLGRYLPQLAPFTILFGEEKSLPEGVRFYHRVLAGDEAGAAQLARTLRSTRGATGLVDELLVPGTAEEKRDRQRGSLDPSLSDRYSEFVEDLASSLVFSDEGNVEPSDPDAKARPLTWCVPLSEDVEAFNARLLASLVRAGGRRAEVVAAEEVGHVGAAPERIVLLACAPIDLGQLRRTLRALRGVAGSAELAVHIAGQEVSANLAERLTRLGVKVVVTRLADLLEPAPEPSVQPPADSVGAVPTSGFAALRSARA